MVVSLIRSPNRARAHPGRACDSFNQLAKKLVTRLVAALEELQAKDAWRGIAYLYEAHADNLES